MEPKKKDDRVPLQNLTYTIHSCMPCFTQMLLTARFKKLRPDNSLIKKTSGLHPAKWNQDFKIIESTPGQ